MKILLDENRLGTVTCQAPCLVKKMHSNENSIYMLFFNDYAETYTLVGLNDTRGIVCGFTKEYINSNFECYNGKLILSNE